MYTIHMESDCPELAYFLLPGIKGIHEQFHKRVHNDSLHPALEK